MKDATPIIEVTTNHWRVPSEDTVNDGWIECEPTEEMKRKVVEETRARRAQWKPTPEGWQLVQELAYLVGSRVQIQFWSPIMFMLEEEGPFPVEADLIHVVIGKEDGFPQAYMRLGNVTEVPTADGCTASWYMTADDNFAGQVLASLADLYTIAKIPSKCHRQT